MGDLENFGKLVNSSDIVTKAMFLCGLICIVLSCLVLVLALLVVILRKKGSGFFT